MRVIEIIGCGVVLAGALVAPASAAVAPTPQADANQQAIRMNAQLAEAHLNAAVIRNAAFAAAAAKWVHTHSDEFRAGGNGVEYGIKTGVILAAGRNCHYQIQWNTPRYIQLDWHWDSAFAHGFCAVARINAPRDGLATVVAFMPAPHVTALKDMGSYQANWTGLKTVTENIAARLATTLLAPHSAVIALDVQNRGVVRGSRLARFDVGQWVDLDAWYNVSRRFRRPSVACVVVVELPNEKPAL